MTFRSDWEAKWKKTWDLTYCDGNWKGITDANDLYFEGVWDASETDLTVTIKLKDQNGAPWAKGCLYEKGTERITGTTEPDFGSKGFSITYTAPARAKLACTETAAIALPASSFLRLTMGFVARHILRPAGMALLRLADRWEGTTGQPGGWTAEEGSNQPLVAFEPRTYERRRA